MGPAQPQTVDMSDMSPDEKIDTLIQSFNILSQQIQVLAAQHTTIQLAINYIAEEIEALKSNRSNIAIPFQPRGH